MPKTSPPRALMTNERRAAILEAVRRDGAVRVADLVRQFEVSAVTIRNDLAELEKENLLVRDHGGATPVGTGRTVTSLLAVNERAGLHMAQKQKIARAAAALVRPGETLLIDAGTTAVEMLHFLAGIPSLTIVTNAVNVALAAANLTDAEVIFLGGAFHRESSSNVGPMTERALGEFLADHLFLGTQAVDLEHGLTDTTLEIAQIKRAMIRSARETVLLADSSKWNTTGSIKVSPLAAAHQIITDAGLPAPLQKQIRKQGLRLTIVP
jgi:DeoR/GlpR family transcriptional regulator of sugar metabolism